MHSKSRDVLHLQNGKILFEFFQEFIVKKQLPLWVGLTTLPSRIDKLKPTLESLISQTVTPNRIFLSIPEFSARENRAYEIPSWLCEFQPILQILHCANDFGPGTKLLGCLRELKE